MTMDLARAATGAAPRRRGAALGMSGRLLLLTVAFVMLASVLIFAPQAANFRSDWMEERLQAARLASLAVEAAPDRMVNNGLASQLLSGAGVVAVAVKREGVRELVLNNAPDGAAAEFTVDMRTLTPLQALLQTPRAFFPAPESHFRIVGEARIDGAEFVEALVPQGPLARELRAWSARTFAMSLIISLITGALIYVTLNIALVRPIRRLTAAMAAFGAQPERAAPTPHAGRNDELGEAQSALADMQRGLSHALRHKQRLAALGEAASRISHDLRNALSTARLLSDRLAADQDPRVRDLGERIVRSVDRAARLAESTLRFGGAADADVQPQTVPMRRALDDAAEEAAPAGGAEWRNGVDADCAVRCDPEHLHRIVLNLLRNAQTAMQGRDPARVAAAAVRRGAMMRITIADTGPGLSDRALARLFQPFANGRGDHQGSGLGLAIARDLARANGGDLRLAHTGPDGAAFELELPAA